MKDQHHQKKETILDKAFQIWGNVHFHDTSLTGLAAEMGMTKPALYRYYSSKDLLEQAMEERALNGYKNHTKDLESKLEEVSSKDWVGTYVEINAQYIRENRPYIRFLAYRCRDGRWLDTLSETLCQRLSTQAERLGLPVLAIRWLDTLSLLASRGTTVHSSDVWRCIWEKGLGNEEQLDQPSFDAIWKQAEAINYEVFPEEPLLKAVFETILNEAEASVSLGKVAQRAGMSKSSLYNYWPSKKAMLEDVFSRLAQHYSHLYTTFIGALGDSKSVVFGTLAFMGTMLRRTPGLLHYLQRMMALGGGKKAMRGAIHQPFHAPLKKVVEQGQLRTCGMKPDTVASLFAISCVSEVRYQIQCSSNEAAFQNNIIDFYRLIIGGKSVLGSTL
ncbi:MAG: TetR/AcrR family transcriptional regulator [Spirochaetales bacterium]|nr:TetR/AcrR family transcriptional regulator [Spirochaetales bacterium]